MSSLKMDLRREGSGLVLVLEGQLDGNSAPEFARLVAEQIEPECRCVVISAGGLQFVSSAGLRELVTLARRLNPLGAKAILVGVTTTVEEVLEVSGIGSFYLRAADTTQALALCQEPEAPSGFFGRWLSGFGKS